MTAEAFKREGAYAYAVSVTPDPDGDWCAVAQIGHVEPGEVISDFREITVFSTVSAQDAVERAEADAVRFIKSLAN